MVKVGRSFSRPSIPRNEAISNSGDGSTAFSIDNPAHCESAANTLGATKSSASDVVALLKAVGGELQYIEFNSVCHEVETRQRWPLLHIVSELLDQPEKPVILQKDGTDI